MIRNLAIISFAGIVLIASMVGGMTFLASNNSIDVETMMVANQLYNSGKFSTAAQIYEQLLSQGKPHSSLYYNLGNTYYAQGDFGRAILNYQRASRLDPRDPEIRANLALARAQSANEIPESSNPFEGLANFTRSWFTLNEIALITLGIWFLFGFMIFTYRQLQPGRMRTLALNGIFLTLLILLAAGVSFGSRLYLDHTKLDAVIIADQVTINSSPGEDSSTDFSLTSGTEVKLLDIQGNWAKLGFANDIYEGWIPLNTIETVSLGYPSGRPTF
jgi:tetratricopeptide (TPR) repeat protein